MQATPLPPLPGRLAPRRLGVARPRTVLVAAVALMMVGLALTSCSTATRTRTDDSEASSATSDTGTPGSAAAEPPASSPPTSPDDEPAGSAPAPTAEVEPQPFQPAGPVGDPEALAALIERLTLQVPPELRAEVPWPDLRNPDPVIAQLAIFDLWVWAAANLPEPALVELMTAEGSPSREEIVGIFGRHQRAGELIRRTGAPYVAFDHRAVTFESAGLPLWLARDVPDDAVVLYYLDQSGPADVIDADTGELLGVLSAVGPLQWLSIMVPTDVGWRLFRDQLIEPDDARFEVPEFGSPSPDADRRSPEV